MKCENQQLTLVGVDRSRVVTEKARGTAFQGYLDLSGEHAECLSSTDKGDNAEEPVAILVLEIDNSFSFFVEKAGQIFVESAANGPIFINFQGLKVIRNGLDLDSGHSKLRRQ